MKVAVIHDWLVTYAGAERVTEQILSLFPEADLFSIVDFLPSEQRGLIGNHRVFTSFLQNIPFAQKKYRNYLPLMPIAIEQFDLSGYDLILSSSHAVAKGIITGPDQLHISYVHTPIRYAWDMQHQYLRETGMDRGVQSWIVRLILHYIRQWDYRTSIGVDHFIANSNFIARRIWKTYRREAHVIYPPVDTDKFSFSDAKEDFYLTASRLVPYKRIDLIVDAFHDLPDKKLIVIGDGPEFYKIKHKAPRNVDFLGYQDSTVLVEYMKRAKAFIFAAEEDFGITPVEAQACGTPVIAFGKGGALETIRGIENDCPTGMFFYEQNICSIVNALRCFEKIESQISSVDCRKNALRFSIDRFRQEMSMFINNFLT